MARMKTNRTADRDQISHAGMEQGNDNRDRRPFIDLEDFLQFGGLDDQDDPGGLFRRSGCQWGSTEIGSSEMSVLG